ncbi:tyrosine-protein kinase receptor torso [Drosophila innubila]|uniref:tyrosine-protein kinase receptor torso n=1 Tax=Drosophila innubila TaxID=198719 RepID=UPI00148E3798|nr:tyrosine-protein kinase receptor torso [Drosophila innubila]
MLIFYAKYALLFGLMFDRNEGAQLLTDQFYEDHTLLNVAACSKDCLESKQAENLLGCINYCNDTDSDSSRESTPKHLHKVQDNFFLKLVCRTESDLSFRIDWVQHSREFVNASAAPDAMFIIKINSRNNSLSSLIYLSDESFFTIADLEDNTEYVISALAMHASGAYSHIVSEEIFQTLRRGYQPSEMMGEVKLRGFHKQPDDWRRVAAEIEWSPSAERNCYFHLLYFSESSRSLETTDPVEFLDPSQLYTYTVPNIEVGEHFKVGVRTVNIKNRLESPVEWLILQAPSCLDWFNYNYTLCAPLKPSNLSVIQQHLKQNNLSLNVTWSLPKYLPDNYTLLILDLHEDYKPARFNVDRNASHYYISNITILGDSFEVHLVAQTQGGKNVTAQMLTKTPLESWLKVRTMISLMIIFLFVPICCIAALFSLKFRSHKQHLEAMATKAAPAQSPDFHLTLAHNNSLLATLAVEDNFELDDELEVEPHAVLLQDVLGEGAFGLVRRGVYKQRQVAVKLLKDQPNEEDVEAFRCEIQMLKGVGRHPNIVGIVGYSTRFSNRMMLLTEYCGLGSLQSFLRDEWKFRQERSAQDMRLKISQRSEKQQTQTLLEPDTRIEDINRSMLSTVEEETDGDLSRSSYNPIDNYRMHNVILAADNKGYGLQDIENIDANPMPPPPIACLKAILKLTSNKPKPVKNSIVSFENQEYFQPIATDIPVTAPREPLKYADLLDIAQQVAVGMDFLAQNKIVHRDLAARNVLISLDRTIKIADFGLSRDVYHENVYRKSGGSGKLPIKWLALESLTHQVYTSQSDVWSFGVLLYEIITLGGMPYPSISPRDLLQLLRQGQRMKRPEGCTDELFKVMESCWCSIPANRPTFADLIKRLDAMLMATKDIPQRILQQLNSKEHSQVEQLTPHDQHYLQPLD